jgi:hypothetical protein
MVYDYQYNEGAGQGAFWDFFYTMEREFALMDAILPFLLIFTIIFAVLQKTKILGVGKKNFNVVVAMVIAASAVIPHITGLYPEDRDPISIMNKALPDISMVIVAIVMALLIIGILGGEAKWMGGSLSGWFAIVAFGIVIYIFGAAAGLWTDWGVRWGFWNENNISLVIIILIFAVVIWYITKSDSDADKAAKGMNYVKELGDMFKPPK